MSHIVASQALPLYEDVVEISYVSYDDQSRCYFYGLRVVRTFRLTGEKHLSQVKRRRFREFLQLHKDVFEPQNVFLPSRFFSTSAETRKPKLERYLNRLIREDAKVHGKMSRSVEKFLGLDAKNAFPPPAMTFAEFEARNQPSMDEKKEALAKNISASTLSFFGAIRIGQMALGSFNSALVLGVVSLLVTIFLLRIASNHTRLKRKRVFELEQQLRTSTVQLNHKPVEDASISKPEAELLPRLRERLVDFASGTTPEYDVEFLKNHGETIRGLLTSIGAPLDTVELSKQDSGRKEVWERSVLVDHRLVPFVRFNSLNLDKAESQARFAMTTRVALNLENIHSMFAPPKNVLDYSASPMLQSLVQNVDAQKEDRINTWWLRDREGCLCMFVRMGHIPSGLVFEEGFNRDAAKMNMTLLWFAELFKKDFDFVHDQSKGRIPGQCTVVADMSGFDLNAQLATSDVLNMVKKYVPLMAPNYSGLLKRYIVINAPWYVNMLLSLVRPFIPKDILDSVKIYSGFDKKTMLDPFIEDKYIPKYLGGELTDQDGNEFCRQRIAPFGPFEQDGGIALLKGK